jgi:hypothetical protein
MANNEIEIIWIKELKLKRKWTVLNSYSKEMKLRLSTKINEYKNISDKI